MKFQFYLFPVLLFFSFLFSSPYHSITIDGDLSDFSDDEILIDDSGDIMDVNNYIDRVYITWDKDYLYIGIQGKVQGNGWLLYVDIFPYSDTGFNDLTDIDNWNKNAKFNNNYVDFFYGSWAGADGNFYKILTSTYSYSINAEVKTDFSFSKPGSEIKISWEELFSDEHGYFPEGLQIGIGASICDGSVLTGDSAKIDNFEVISVDSDSDGIPDDRYRDYSGIKNITLSSVIFSPNRDGIKDSLSINFEILSPGKVSIDVFSLRGVLVEHLFEKNYSTSYNSSEFETVEWSPEGISPGIYILNFIFEGPSSVFRKNFSTVVIK